MSSQVTAKVLFNGTLRQTKISSTTAWSEFENSIRNAHKVPASSSILVTYSDSDGDVIALDTDRELADAVNQAGKGPIRFEINIRDPESASFVVVNPSNSSQTSEPADPEVDSPILVSAELDSEHPQDTKQENAHNGEKAEADAKIDALDETHNVAEKETSEVRNEKGKQSAEASSSTSSSHHKKSEESSSSSSSSSQNSPEPSEKSPFTSLHESLSPILEQIQAEFDANPEFITKLTDLFTQAGEQVESHMEPIMEEIARQINEAQRQSYSGYYRPCGPRFYGHPEMYGRCSSYPRGRCGMNQTHCRPENWQKFADRGQEPRGISEKVMQERIKQMQDMGFGDEEVVADLLKRYDGNVARAVEVILRG
ncbi:hypothetical protein HK098_006201 [Nowakowskiella sp. JEL0407]|nr:hypothetical protein HK098_006201 [Nowakowskiella sp. JEL0407]